jgi:hypothetical protein
MSHLGRTGRDLAIPPRPTRISMAGGSWARPPTPRGAPSRPRPGPVQEACRVGFVALALSWAAAEVAFLLRG